MNSISHTLLANTALNLPFFLLPIISVAILSPAHADVFAILFTIGQIINFGISSFLSLIIPFTARGKSTAIFWLSIFFILFAGVIAVLLFVWQRDILFSVFSRPEYALYVPEMILYFSAVALFNLLFFFGRYAIGKGNQTSLFPLFGVVLLWSIGIVYADVETLYVFLWSVLGLIVCGVACLLLFTSRSEK